MLKLVKNESPSVLEHICDTQGKIYKLAMQKGYSLSDFSDNYLKSEFCEKEMDAIYSTWQYQDEDVCFEVIEEQIKHSFSQDNYSEYDVYWVGYMYRYLFYYSAFSSRQLADLISFKKMMLYSIECEDYDYEDAAEYILTHSSEIKVIKVV